MFDDRWYQKEAVDRIFDFAARKRDGRPVVAAPTGTGKSIIIGRVIERAFSHFPQSRMQIIAPSKELVGQNADKFLRMYPSAPVGLHSAGLKRRDTVHPIIFGGIQSMYKTPEKFGTVHSICVDEAHTVNPETGRMFTQYFDGILQTNPHCFIWGLSATIYRQGMGFITDDGFFTDVVFDITNIEGFRRLIAEGYIVPLIPRPTKTQLDISGVGVGKDGDFIEGQLQAAIDRSDITYSICQEMVYYGQNYRSWIAFASGVEHAEHLAGMLWQFGIDAKAIHSKIPEKERDALIAAHRNGGLRCAVVNNMLTTGYDNPIADFCAMVRPTKSVPLWVQMLGRFTRPSPGKSHALVLDFARNTARLGPIDDPVIPRKKGEKPGDVPVKICDFCGAYNHTTARVCIQCDEEFPPQSPDVTRHASELSLMVSAATLEPNLERHAVDRILYFRQQHGEKPAVLKVVYDCTTTAAASFVEWIHVERGDGLGKTARQWWKQRHVVDMPPTVIDCMPLTNELRRPSHITVWVNKKPYPEIKSYEWAA